MKTAVMTDTNSGIMKAEADSMGIFLIPMPVIINDETHYEGIDLTETSFYESLTGGKNVSTSQPSPGDLMDLWDDIFEQGYDEIIHIPMSSGLSASCSTAISLSDDYDGKVQVVNNQRISVTMRQSVIDAKALADKGKNAEEIKDILEAHKMDSSIYITLETLKYLKKGGRITPAAAAIGTMLKLNPVLQIQGEKLDAFAKARGKSSAKKIMLKAMKDDCDNRFKDYAQQGKLHMEVAYTGNEEEAREWAEAVKEAFPQYDFHMDPLSLSVACHIGYGSLAIAVSAYVPEAE